MQQLSVVILAAGKGKRMVSDMPKVLHRVGGQPLLGHVLATASSLEAATRVVVYGYGGEAVKAAFASEAGVVWVDQAEQLGTGHAVAQALPQIEESGVVLVLYGDVPLTRLETLQPLVAAARQGKLALLTVELADPHGYGRIVRNGAGQVQRIVEEKDATPEERSLHEINTGILAVSAAQLRGWVSQLTNDNAQGEYYLTDVIALAVHDGVAVEPFTVTEPAEVLGVNDRRQLAELERFYQRRQADTLLLGGVTLLDPARVDLRGTVVAGKDVVVDVNVVFEGVVRLGDRVRIGPFCVLKDAVIGDDVEIQSHCRVEGAEVGAGAQIGPFARLRPDTRLAAGVHIGNFVETKKTSIGPGSKVNHLTYLGDAEIGAAVNVGAGTITCNYDGANKHKTIVEDGAFIGSNSSLVAPVRIGKGATVGAGSSVSRDVPEGGLCLTRPPRKDVANWQRPVKPKQS
ncbi:MAG TPA: bifunctional UDP-N-acetylglucosamine diphosphorylase/glucosamine-1-phosphate N-acetyltransferase GlmU [Candidatus Competibacteraceae bacterium]|nr:bifunctional UDP-N-acetylglucosamine diphosphorylase/glucosamine-1-phosphate N-acetyltransferase GlmU [Candidatus Competibacteraceae bacterium]HQD56553.1 bifunctional UDP-N-acetylglucosamine diphosphorylase/glucosamine-1-phosphate N-acetyltransferase GlmU [Candidatus Competibacteraceae bacterium]